MDLAPELKNESEKNSLVVEKVYPMGNLAGPIGLKRGFLRRPETIELLDGGISVGAQEESVCSRGGLDTMPKSQLSASSGPTKEGNLSVGVPCWLLGLKRVGTLLLDLGWMSLFLKSYLRELSLQLSLFWRS